AAQSTVLHWVASRPNLIRPFSIRRCRTPSPEVPPGRSRGPTRPPLAQSVAAYPKSSKSSRTPYPLQCPERRPSMPAALPVHRRDCLARTHARNHRTRPLGEAVVSPKRIRKKRAGAHSGSDRILVRDESDARRSALDSAAAYLEL